MNLFLLLSGCFTGLGYDYSPWLPDLSVSTQVPNAENSSVRLVEEYLLPVTVADWDPDVISRCREGEDMRAHFTNQYAMVEVQRWGVLLNGMYTVSLNDGVLDYSGHRGLLLPALYDQLMSMRLNAQATMAGLPCWPEFDGRLLVVAESASDWALMKRVVYTAHQAGFENVDLLVDDAVALSAAVTDPPYEAFSKRTLKVDEEPVVRLSDEEIARARETLASGQRIRPVSSVCADRLIADVEEDGDAMYISEPFYGKALSLEGPTHPSHVRADGNLELLLRAHPDTEYGDVVDALSTVRAYSPTAALMWDEQSDDIPSYSPIGVVATSTWMSYTKDSWVPVIELDPESFWSQSSCIDSEGTLRER